MRTAFFISSSGDSDLALATISQLAQNRLMERIFLIPLTQTAIDKTKTLPLEEKVTLISLDEITLQGTNLSNNLIAEEDLEKVKLFITTNDIQRAYIGVPSDENEIPFQIACRLTIPCTIAYEYMFKPQNHCFWKYLPELALKETCDYAVSLKTAEDDILKINPKAQTHIVGHLSLDKLPIEISDTTEVEIKKLLSLTLDDEFIFVSGSTRSMEIDDEFIKTLLTELAKGEYPNLQLRMWLHPGTKKLDEYLKRLLSTCETYEKEFPELSNQFKIVLNNQIIKKFENLKKPIPTSPFLLRVDVSSQVAAQIAKKITQAVAGAFPNNSAFLGKPTYCPDDTFYLPKKWFKETPSSFFKAKPEPRHSKDELNLNDTVTNEMTKLMSR